MRVNGRVTVTNDSDRMAVPFRVRCTRPDLFKVRPHVGVIGPQQQMTISITSQHAPSPQFTQQLKDIVFKIEYVSLLNPP